MTLPKFSLPQLISHVRSALAHIYDQAYLQNHPLAETMDAAQELDQVSRAQQLRRTLLDYLEALNPPANPETPAEARRAYAILTYRYVDGLSMEEIVAKLALSRRQVYREHAKGIEAIARLLWDETGGRPGQATLNPVDSQGDLTDEIDGTVFYQAAGRYGAGSEREQQDGPAGHDAERLAAAQVEVNRLRHNNNAELLAVGEIAQSICELLAPRLEQTHVHIKIHTAAAWPEVVGDRMMVRQILLSLFSHAVQVTEHSGTVTVRGRGLGEALELSIGGWYGKNRTPARGVVSLLVAHTLIEAQGGRLHIVDNTPVWQATLTLPTAATPTVLVVDDNHELINLFQRYLGGHRVLLVGATDGQQALAMAMDIQPQLILLDLMLPVQDGWEILGRLQQEELLRSIPVIVCSVLHEVDLALAMGASDYITKPVSQSKLLTVLRRWLGTLHLAA